VAVPRRPPLRLSGAKKVSVLDALGVSRLTVDGEGKEGRAHVLASLAALQREGVCDAVLTSTAEVFLYGATRCFECPSFFQLRSSGLLERTSRSHAVFGAASSEALAHRRILAFAALVGCTKSNGEKTLRLTAHDALQFINTSGPGDDALADVQVWAAQQALPLQCDVDAYLAAGDARVVSLTRRPNLEMILGLHWKLMIVGSSDNRSHSSGELRSAVQKLLARLEVDAPGLSLPLQVTKEHSARVEAATHVAPVEFAHCSKASANEGDLAELPRDSDIVRVLWRATAGVGQPRRLFSTVEASAAFKSVYPMLRPGDAPNRLKVRGFFGI